jgi:hypothetical protein
MNAANAVEAHTDTIDTSGRAAIGRLKLLSEVLAELGLSGIIRRIEGWPVLFIIEPAAPWAVSVGDAHFWVGDPPQMIAPNDRVLETAWVIAELLGRRP